jgi:hypothetical protein
MFFKPVRVGRKGVPSSMRRSSILIIGTTAYTPEIRACQQEITGSFI